MRPNSSTLLLLPLIPALLLLFAVSQSISRKQLHFEYSHITTHINYSDVAKNLYEKIGFSLSKRNVHHSGEYPIILLDPPPNICVEVLALTPQKASKTEVPPKSIPSDLRSEYLMDGLANLGNWYLNNVQKGGSVINWTPEQFQVLQKKVSAQEFGDFPYGNEVASLYYAMKNHVPSGRGLVIGSLSPWVEAIASHFGRVQSTLTSEYSIVNSAIPNVNVITPPELLRQHSTIGKFDFAVSFSSIEHSGLGRYGDPLNPWGDVQESQKVRCLLKPGALFYLGLPGGKDALWWNVHRIYGLVRWPLMAAGWDFVGLFHTSKPEPLSKAEMEQWLTKKTGSTAIHFVMVLRKT